MVFVFSKGVPTYGLARVYRARVSLSLYFRDKSLRAKIKILIFFLYYRDDFHAGSVTRLRMQFANRKRITGGCGMRSGSGIPGLVHGSRPLPPRGSGDARVNPRFIL